MKKPDKELEEIMSKLKFLEEAKPQVLTRREAAYALIPKVESQKDKFDLEEAEKEMITDTLDGIKSLCSSLNDYVAEIQMETERVTEAVEAIKSDNLTSLRKAFKKFILTDVALSRKNVYMMLYDFDGIIESLKRISEKK